MAFKKTKDVNHWPKVKAELQVLDGAIVKVGITKVHGGKRGQNSKATLAEYATYNELGTSTIPARPFISTTADEKRTAWGNLQDKLIEQILDRKIKAMKALESVGKQAVLDIKSKIQSITSPPNAPSTIKQKGSSKPLFESGMLQDSIDYEVTR